MRKFTYKEAINEVADFIIDEQQATCKTDTAFEMRENGTDYIVFVNTKGIEVCKDMYQEDAELDKELTAKFVSDVLLRLQELEDNAKTASVPFEATYSQNDHYLKTVGYTHYSYK